MNWSAIEECSIYDEDKSTRCIGVYRSKNVGMSNDWKLESSTPKVQGFHSNVRRLWVRQDLRLNRKAKSMESWLIFQPLNIKEGVTHWVVYILTICKSNN